MPYSLPASDWAQRDCSALSLEQSEPLAGTAPRVDTWLLLGYAGVMGTNAFAESDIPEAVKGWIDQALGAIPHSRMLVIKPNSVNRDQQIEFIVVHAREADPFYYTFRLERYEDLLDLEIRALIAGEPSDRASPEREPFYLVCTNGKRDPCCARYGQGVFETLRRLGNGRVWQCSHVDGHRFAANTLLFPHGIYYGRVRQETAGDLFEAGASGRIALDHYRGRACYDPVVQAGEALLRSETGILQLAGFRLADRVQLEENLWEVSFLSQVDDRIHRLTIRSGKSTEPVYLSCRSDKQAPFVSYKLAARGLSLKADSL
jgi:hypothetical protein